MTSFWLVVRVGHMSPNLVRQEFTHGQAQVRTGTGTQVAPNRLPEGRLDTRHVWDALVRKPDRLPRMRFTRIGDTGTYGRSSVPKAVNLTAWAELCYTLGLG